MGQLGNLTYNDVARKLRRLGFVLDRSGKGSHELWRHADDGRRTTVTNHRGNLDERTVRSILRLAKIDVEAFLKA